MNHTSFLKKLLRGISFVSLMMLFSCSVFKPAEKQEVKKPLSLEQFINRLPGAEITKMDTGRGFTANYKIMLTQPLHHDHPGKGSFQQRIFLAHKDTAKPVVLVTEGYTAGYAANPHYRHEVTKMLDANQITVEHRFFGESAPSDIDWQYMTVEQAATDHHRIVELFNEYYRGKWINTGISKGGQTALYHRYHYPEDVDVTVGYVCPLNFDDADTRVYDFLDSVGTATCRQKLHNFQKSMLKEKETMLSLFIQASKEKGYTYSMGYEAAYEYVILEYPFAFWQWGADCTEIPVGAAGDTARIRHLLSVSPMDYFADQGTERMWPFFYQALTEIGYYGYEPSEFGGLIKAVDDSTFNFLAPDTIPVSFDETHMRKVNRWLQNDAEQMLFLYGQYDPWSATGVTAAGNPGVVKIVKPEGSHRTRIRNLPDEQQEKVYQLLEAWLRVAVTKL